MESPAPHPDCIDTALFHLLIASFAAAAGRLLDGALNSKAFKTLNTINAQIALISREICQIESFNYGLSLKANMLADPEWKRRVWLELGGYWVIKRWRARYYFKSAAGAQAPQSIRYGDISDVSDDNDYDEVECEGGPKTHARQSQFRLAPIPRDRSASSSYSSFGLSGLYGGAETYELAGGTDYSEPQVFMPIALLPHEIACGENESYDLSAKVILDGDVSERDVSDEAVPEVSVSSAKVLKTYIRRPSRANLMPFLANFPSPLIGWQDRQPPQSCGYDPPYSHIEKNSNGP